MNMTARDSDMASAARKAKQASCNSPEPVAHLSAVAEQMHALAVARAEASVAGRSTTPLFGRAPANPELNMGEDVQVWQMIAQYFEGAKTYTLAFGAAEVSFTVDAKGEFEVAPQEAAKVPLYGIAKRIR
jgi:hypothetical protein